jgi:hypothetical protein
MGSMLDLPDALRSAGLRVFVAPDWRTNGHDIDLLDSPYGGVLHHTAGLGLRSVYGLPDARPDVPQPRANLWTPKPGTQDYDIAVLCAGRAWHAGTNNSTAHADLRAGRFGMDVADALDRFGKHSDDLDAGFTSANTVGNEVENLGTAADEWPEAQLDVVATAMRVCVEVFGWPGVGAWAHHRQLTWRKPDMSYRGDLWTRASGARLAATEEDGMTNEQAERLLQLAEATARMMSPMAQRVADIERRQLAFNNQEGGRDAAAQGRDERLAAEFARARADLDQLLARR